MMVGWVNPFKKHDVSEFEGVYVPLANAPRHPSVVAAHEAKFGSVSGKPVDHVGHLGHDNGIETAEISINPYNAYTVEGLRAEIDSDIAASGHDTAYDRM